jgi:hypothetical protein
MLTPLERQERVRSMYARLHPVIGSFDFVEAEKFRPDFVSEFWENYDLLDEYCARYIEGGFIDWETDILAQAKYLFNIQHDFNCPDDLKVGSRTMQLALFQ